MAELSIEVGAPCIKDTSLIDGRCRATFMSLLINLNINELDAFHANFLRCTEYSKLARSPDYELILISNSSRKTSGCHMNDIVDSQLIKLKW